MTKPHARGIVMLMCAVQFIDVLGIAVVAVALPTMSRELDMAPSISSLVAIIYALLFGAFLVPAGRIADLLGHRPMLLLGLAVFGAGSLVGGVATSAWLVVASRALQGIAAAIAVPAALALLTSAVPAGPERHRALGLWTAAGAAGGASGYAVGGIMTELIGWRSLFFLNVPIVAIALFVAPRMIPPAILQPGSRRAPDMPSVALLPAGLLLLTIGITGFQDAQSMNPVIMTQIVAGATLLVLTFARMRSMPNPVLPLHVLRNPGLRST